jgi:dTDP-L-rhamnose 4-epimerase
VVEAILASGHEVRVVDRNPAWTVEGAELIEADLSEPGVAESAVAGIDAVSHQAARVGLGTDFTDAPGYVADNQLATARLLGALTKTRFAGRLVLASSMVVYGEGRYRCASHGSMRPPPRRPDDLSAGLFEPRCGHCGEPLSWDPVEESAPLDPRSVYAASKLDQEQLCAIWARETGASVVALRYHNVYGKRLPLNTPYAGVAAIWTTSLQQGEPPQVFEDGGQTRDFVHVTDVAAANEAAIELPLAAGSIEAVNICSGVPVTILEVAERLCDSFGPGAPRPKVTREYRLGDVRHVVASPKRATTILGFRAKIPLAQGLGDLAQAMGSAGRCR